MTESSSRSAEPCALAIKSSSALRHPRFDIADELASCQRCSYWLRASDAYCPDCGALSSHHRAPWRPPILRRWRKLGAAVGAGGMLVGLVLVGAPVGGAMLLLSSVGLGTGAMLGDQKARGDIRRLQLAGRRKDCYQATERQLYQRIAASEAVMARSKEVLETAEGVIEAPEKLASVRALDTARRTARRAELERYTVGLWTIEFLRWHNCLQPVVAGIHAVTSNQQAERRGVFAKQLRRAGEAAHAAWSLEPAARSEEGRGFLEAFRTAIEGVQTIAEEISMRACQLVDTEAGNLRRHDDPVLLSPVLLHELQRVEQLGHQLAAGVFSTAQEQIEAMQARLLAEAEVEELG